MSSVEQTDNNSGIIILFLSISVRVVLGSRYSVETQSPDGFMSLAEKMPFADVSTFLSVILKPISIAYLLCSEPNTIRFNVGLITIGLFYTIFSCVKVLKIFSAHPGVYNLEFSLPPCGGKLKDL